MSAVLDAPAGRNPERSPPKAEFASVGRHRTCLADQMLADSRI